jgi:hypothetical protein
MLDYGNIIELIKLYKYRFVIDNLRKKRGMIKIRLLILIFLIGFFPFSPNRFYYYCAKLA